MRCWRRVRRWVLRRIARLYGAHFLQKIQKVIFYGPDNIFLYHMLITFFRQHAYQYYFRNGFWHTFAALFISFFCCCWTRLATTIEMIDPAGAEMLANFRLWFKSRFASHTGFLKKVDPNGTRQVHFATYISTIFCCHINQCLLQYLWAKLHLICTKSFSPDHIFFCLF